MLFCAMENEHSSLPFSWAGRGVLYDVRTKIFAIEIETDTEVELDLGLQRWTKS